MKMISKLIEILKSLDKNETLCDRMNLDIGCEQCCFKDISLDKLLSELEAIQKDKQQIEFELLNALSYRVEGIYNGEDIQDIISDWINKRK